MAIITAMDADHLDIYGTAEAMEQAFIDFSKKVKPGGIAGQQVWIEKRKRVERQTDILLTACKMKALMYMLLISG